MALAERDHIRTIEDLIREMAGGLIYIHRPREEHIPPHRDLRRILLTVVEARGERWIVQTDHRMILFLQHGNELCEIMLHTRQIHLIEADDVLSGCAAASIRSSASPVSALRYTIFFIST